MHRPCTAGAWFWTRRGLLSSVPKPPSRAARAAPGPDWGHAPGVGAATAPKTAARGYIAVTLFDRMLRRESIRGNKLPDTTAPNRSRKDAGQSRAIVSAVNNVLPSSNVSAVTIRCHGSACSMRANRAGLSRWPISRGVRAVRPPHLQDGSGSPTRLFLRCGSVHGRLRPPGASPRTQVAWCRGCAHTCTAISRSSSLPGWC